MIAIDVIQKRAISGMELNAQQVGNLAGHFVTVIQSFQKLMQQHAIAYASLIFVNLLAFEIAKLAVRVLYAMSSQEGSVDQRAIAEKGVGVAGLGVLIISVALFAKVAQLPFGTLAILCTSIATLAMRLLFGHVVREART